MTKQYAIVQNIKTEDEKGHFNISRGVNHQGNINSLLGNLKNPTFSLGRNRLNDIR